MAAYVGKEMVGVLLVDIKGKKKVYKSFWKNFYVNAFEWIQKNFFKDSVGIYDEVNQEMLNHYTKENNVDGEIRFLVAKPNNKIKGIGTKLLEELERKEKGKRIYLFTDDQCTYQFYEHRGFQRVGEKEIQLAIGGKEVPLSCFLYSKIM